MSGAVEQRGEKMRLIDADALNDLIRESTIMGDGFVRAVVAIVNGEPTVQPEPQWIPCSETVDIPDHEIMACDKYGEIMLGYLVYEDDQWICESDGCEMVDPIAWREKPEPYKGET